MPPRWLYVLLPLALAGGVLGFAAGSRKDKPAVPRAEFTEFVDLGACPQGGIAVGRFRVKNSGEGDLTVQNFRTSCSCAGVEREVDGKYLRVQSLRLSAGEQVDLTIRVNVTVLAGQQQRIGISFETNDPERPRGGLDALVSKVLGGVIPLPSVVSCGELAVGSRATFTLGLYDNGQAGRRIESVRSTQPERFGVRLLPAAPSQSREMMGHLLAQVEIAPNTSREGVLDGEVEVVLADEGRPADRISVTGRVISDIEVVPQTLLLPRTVDGLAVYHAQVRVRSREGKPVSVRVLSAEEPLSAEALPSKDGKDGASVRIEWKPGKDRPAEAQIRAVRLRIVSEGKEYDREVKVLLRGGGGATP